MQLREKRLKMAGNCTSSESDSSLQAFDATKWIELQKHLIDTMPGIVLFKSVETEWYLPNITLHVSAQNPI